MRKSLIMAAGTMALVLAGATAVVAEERYEDGVGDAIGEAPDIVAVTFSQPAGEPRVSLSIEFAEEPPLETDGETYTDLVWIHLDVDPETAQTIQFETEDDEFDYIIGTAAVQLPLFLETGGMLYEEDTGELYEGVIDVEVTGATVTWTLDRELIGDPDAIAWGVLATVQADVTDEFAFDVSPNEGEPWGVYELTTPEVAGEEVGDG